ILSNSTWTPARVLDTAPEEFTENSTPAAGVDGPRLLPLMAISSPGAITPAEPVALFRITTGTGAAGAATVSDTGIESGVVSTPVPLMEIEPLYVCAVSPCGFTDTLMVCGVAPPVVFTESQPLELALTPMVTAPPVLVTLSCCAGGAVPP